MSESTRTTVALYCGVAVLSVLCVLPSLIGILADQLHWTDRVVGQFASADLGGLVVGTVIYGRAARRLTSAYVLIGGGLLLVAANLLSMLSNDSISIVVLRCVGGIGTGLSIGVCYAVFAHGRPARNLGIFQVGQQVLSIGGPWVLPAVAARWGWQACFAVLAAVAFPVLVIGRGVAGVSISPGDSKTGRTRIATPPSIWFAVAGMVAYFVGQGAIWAYVERIGSAAGIRSDAVQESLSICAFFGLVACAIPILAGVRHGRMYPLVASFCAAVTGLLLVGSASVPVYRFAVSIFMIGWTVFAAYQFEAIVDADAVGTATLSLSTATYVGFMIGPVLAGELATVGGYNLIRWLCIATNTIALVSLIPICLLSPTKATR